MRDTTKFVIITLTAIAVIGIAVGISSARMAGYAGMMGGWQKDGALWSDNPLTSGYGRMMGGYGYGGMQGMMLRNGNQGAFCSYGVSGVSSIAGACFANNTYSCPWTAYGR